MATKANSGASLTWDLDLAGEAAASPTGARGQSFPSRLPTGHISRGTDGGVRGVTVPGPPRAVAPELRAQRVSSPRLTASSPPPPASPPLTFRPRRLPPRPPQALCFDSRLRSSRRRRQAHPPLPLPHRTAPVAKPTPFWAPSAPPPPRPAPRRGRLARGMLGARAVGGAGPRGPAASSGSVPSR